MAAAASDWVAGERGVYWRQPILECSLMHTGRKKLILCTYTHSILQWDWFEPLPLFELHLGLFIIIYLSVLMIHQVTSLSQDLHNLERPVIGCMSLECGRKPEYLEVTHADKWTQCKLQTKDPGLLLWTEHWHITIIKVDISGGWLIGELHPPKILRQKAM